MRTLALGLAAALCACTSTGFDRGALRRQFGDGSAVQVSEQEIAAALDRKPQLPARFRLGVVFRDPTPHAAIFERAPNWRWTLEDRQKINRALSVLKDQGLASDIFPVIDVNGARNGDLRGLRLAAAEHGADAVLIITGAADLDRYTNALAFTYIALLPALFVPASKADALFVARAALWDVRNQFLYFTAESESVQKQTRPAAFIDAKHLLEVAQRDALDQLTQEVALRMQGTSGSPGR